MTDNAASLADRLRPAIAGEVRFARRSRRGRARQIAPAELIEFGKDRRWHRGLLKLAESSASGSHQQWVEFCHEFKRRPAPSLAA